MRKFLIQAVAMLILPASLMAGSQRATVSFTTNGVPLSTDTFKNFSGYVQEVLVDVTSGAGQSAGFTGTVTIAAVAPGTVSGLANRTILSANVTGGAAYRPRVAGHNTDGTTNALAVATLEPFFLYGETVQISVTNIGVVATQLTYTAVIKYSEGK